MSKYSKLTIKDLNDELLAKMSISEIFELGAREVEGLEDL